MHPIKLYRLEANGVYSLKEQWLGSNAYSNWAYAVQDAVAVNKIAKPDPGQYLVSLGGSTLQKIEIVQDELVYREVRN